MILGVFIHKIGSKEGLEKICVEGDQRGFYSSYLRC